MRKRSALAMLGAMPRRFRFDAAVRVLTRARQAQDPAEAVRFRSPAGLVYPPAEVIEVRQQGSALPDVTVGLMGLTGPSGVLPRFYSEMVTQTLRSRSTALRDFLDLLTHRFVAFFAGAGMKYRPARSAEAAALRKVAGPDQVTQVLLALTGFGTAHLSQRLAAGSEPLLHYAGLFALRPRSADRLGALTSDWLGMTVEVVEFAGAWLPLPPDQRTRLGAHGAWGRLGVDAAAGVRAWDPQARIILRVGPLDLKGFQRLLPDRIALHRLVSLVRAYVGFELGFAINPVLAAQEVPPLQLNATADPPPRLGWNTWVPGPTGGLARQTDAADAIFEAEVIEAQRVDWRNMEQAA
ncbi:MAG TPA: type VI secretion system baseplate subunit TssG [Acetobacteraceae bacterium]|jgi:type VI secretion system protein ImpH|nr:type VI secretion system baseplate subunit TssG [Acetobacteraceae bacterium]